MIRASEHGKRVHPTQKPVALAAWAFSVLDANNEHHVVLDAFGGSGSTLIAAHDTGRTACVIEREPAYIDVICRRFQEHTGTLPILKSTGEEHDFTLQSVGGYDATQKQPTHA
ncbi:MAG: DNA methyltransferase [Candidatus Dormibacteria bacterium]